MSPLRTSASRLLRRVRFSLGGGGGTIATAAATSSASATSTNSAPLPLPLSTNPKCSCISRFFFRQKGSEDVSLQFMVYAQAAIFFAICSQPVFADGNSVEPSSENDPEDVEGPQLRRVDDGSIISNEHTMKWRIFTDNGRDYFQKGKLADAEKFFLSALREAKEGFGEKDAHVASACNNLAELYRVMKAFDKAEPLYLEAINILRDSFGPEDIRVGVALHNLGQFYLAQRNFEDARSCYEQALKIKGRILGYNHPDYADTMYHLGTVLDLQGNEKESEAFIVDSIRILEEAGQGQSSLYMRRLRRLAQVYLKSNRLVDAENVQRKILHALELAKGWETLDTAVAAEGLALTLQSTGKLLEAHELLQRCLDTRKRLLPENHIQIGANMLLLAKVAILYSTLQRNRSISDATAHLINGKDYLESSIRIAEQVLSKSKKRKGFFSKEDPAERRNVHAAMIILIQSLDALGYLEVERLGIQESKDNSGYAEAEKALSRCMDAYKEFGRGSSISDSIEVKTEYLKCLKHLLGLLTGTDAQGTKRHSWKLTVKEVEEEINQVENEISAAKRPTR